MYPTKNLLYCIIEIFFKHHKKLGKKKKKKILRCVLLCINHLHSKSTIMNMKEKRSDLRLRISINTEQIKMSSAINYVWEKKTKDRSIIKYK